MIEHPSNDGCTIVIDIGKTNAKASLWDAAGRPIANRRRANAPQQAAGYRALDVGGIDRWLIESLREFAQQATVTRIVTVGHGAAAALLQEGRLYAAPMDYEDEGSAQDRADYVLLRDSFAVTGSPLLPCGLNLGMQLHRLERLHGPLPRNVTIVPWPQFWSWRLCGIAASEVSSLGCHTDLWQPLARSFSPLAVGRGWAARMAPLRAAGAQLGNISAEIAAQTRLPTSCAVLCGMHDSNAALLAARGHSEIANHDATVLSTGTWFVAMRSLATDITIDPGTLDASRDCLVNVDIFGRPVPSARFMGGREAELIGGIDSAAPTVNDNPEALISRLPALMASGAAVYPSFVPAVGPFPRSAGEWRNKPLDPGDRRAITGLYLALMADAALDLIDSRERLLIEGRFAEANVFVRALAALRPRQRIFVSDAHQDVAYGALRLVTSHLPPPCELTPVKPLDLDLAAYAAMWRTRAHASQSAA
jgi:sugar (pentulose or hexulose) kinase